MKGSNKRKSFIEPVGMHGFNFKNETLFVREMAQTFISEIEWLAALKCHATSLSTSLFLTERKCSANLSDKFCHIYCIFSIKCCKLYIGETGRRLSDRFAEHLRSVRNNDVDKPVARHFNTVNHSISDIKVCAI